jgi:hypothetical protein
MPVRKGDSNIVRFLRSLERALLVRVTDPGASTAIARVQMAIESTRPGQSGGAARLPVCGYLARALETARASSEPLAALADAFAAIEPRLHWARRPVGGPCASENWLEGHANAMIIGPDGLEWSEDLQVGVSLMAPDVRYPDHNHLPEELYDGLSSGRFKHGSSSWIQPGIGGTIHNEPNVTHAMASDNAPFLAIWSLWNA